MNSNQAPPEAAITDLADPSLGTIPGNRLKLAVSVSWDRISWGAWDPEQKLWLYLASERSGKLQLPGQLLDFIRTLWDKHQRLKEDYHDVTIIWEGLNHTLIPQSLFVAEEEASFLTFTNIVHSGEEIRSEVIPRGSLVLVYALPAVLRAGLEQIWPGHSLTHGISRFLRPSALDVEGRQYDVRTHIREQSFDLIIFRDGALLYCNTFEYRTSEDLLYYILFTFEQLGIPPAETEVRVTGDLFSESQIFEYLEKYIDRVTFAGPGSRVILADGLKELPYHQFCQLLNIFT